MAIRVFKFIFLIIAAIFTVFFIFIIFKQISFTEIPYPISDSNKISNPEIFQRISTTTESIVKIIKVKPKTISFVPSVIKSKIPETASVKEVSSKSFEELINDSVIQLYCGNLNAENTDFSNIARGTGVIIDGKGEILTNRHIIYDENAGKLRPDCFVLKSPFPNINSQKPKIYYAAEIENYPLKEKFNDSFSKDKYYNDFAVLKITSKPDSSSKINLLLGFDYALPENYFAIENGPNKYNYLPIDWYYKPENDDVLITLGYGVDATHSANQITSTFGKLSGNINVDQNSNPEIILVESNATAGFSGGALVNPKSKGLIGLIGWITSGDEAGKYTVTIFRDFLRILMIEDLNLDLKLMQNQ